MELLLAFEQTRMGPTGLPTVVDIAASRPAGVKTEVILRTPVSDDIWGESAFTDPTTTSFDPKVDLRSPVPMGVAATSAAGQKVVVIGAKSFANNDLLEAIVPVQDRGERSAP